MHIYFSGIGGAGIGPLALIAKQAGFTVSGSDIKKSQYTEYLINHGVKLHIGQTNDQIAKEHLEIPIDWIVFSSAVSIENPNHPELVFAAKNKIKTSKRDEFLNQLLIEKKLKLIAVAGTHGKTTATAMLVWTFKKLGIPVSYSVGAKISFGDMGSFDPDSDYFIYECDEFDRNFLNFKPYLSIITTVDWDHHDIFKTRNDYKDAFRQFIAQSDNTVLFDKDLAYLGLSADQSLTIIEQDNPALNLINLPGLHNRENALAVISGIQKITNEPINKILSDINEYPGSERRFEQLAPNIYTDYAHTPEEIAAMLQLAKEVNNKVVVVYEPLTNKRQHYSKDHYYSVFEPAEKVYWAPSYLAREDPGQHVLTPDELIAGLSPKTNANSVKLNDELLELINSHAAGGELVLCLTGGGGNSLDEFLRANLKKVQ